MLQCYRDGVELTSMMQTVTMTGSHGNPTAMRVLLIDKKGQDPGYKLLLETADHSLTMLSQPGTDSQSGECLESYKF